MAEEESLQPGLLTSPAEEMLGRMIGETLRAPACEQHGDTEARL
jgi:hypothetical protein